MASSSKPVGNSGPPETPDSKLPVAYRSSSTLYQLQIALLQSQVSTLQTALEQERKRQQAIVDRYERMLENR